MPGGINDRFRFQVGVQDVIYPEDWKAQDDPLRYITQRYTKGIEDFVRTTRPIPLGPPPLEEPSQGRDAGGIRLISRAQATGGRTAELGPTKAFAHFSQTVADKAMAEVLVLDQVADRRRNFCRPVVGHQDARLARPHDVADPRHVGRHDRDSRRHRFDEDQPKALRERREHEPAQPAEHVLRPREPSRALSRRGRASAQ